MRFGDPEMITPLSYALSAATSRRVLRHVDVPALETHLVRLQPRLAHARFMRVGCKALPWMVRLCEGPAHARGP